MTARIEGDGSPLEAIVRIASALAASQRTTRSEAAEELLHSSGNTLNMIQDVAVLVVTSVRVIRRLRLFARDLDSVVQLLRQHVQLEIGDIDASTPQRGGLP